MPRRPLQCKTNLSPLRDTRAPSHLLRAHELLSLERQHRLVLIKARQGPPVCVKHRIIMICEGLRGEKTRREDRRSDGSSRLVRLACGDRGLAHTATPSPLHQDLLPFCVGLRERGLRRNSRAGPGNEMLRVQVRSGQQHLGQAPSLQPPTRAGRVRDGGGLAPETNPQHCMCCDPEAAGSLHQWVEAHHCGPPG